MRFPRRLNSVERKPGARTTNNTRKSYRALSHDKRRNGGECGEFQGKKLSRLIAQQSGAKKNTVQSIRFVQYIFFKKRHHFYCLKDKEKKRLSVNGAKDTGEKKSLYSFEF